MSTTTKPRNPMGLASAGQTPAVWDLMPYSMRLGDECRLDGKVLRVVRVDVEGLLAVAGVGVEGSVCSLCALRAHAGNRDGAWCCMAEQGAAHYELSLVDVNDIPGLTMKGIIA